MRSYDIAVISPQCLLGYVDRAQDLDLTPEAANQRDVDESRSLVEAAYERALETTRLRYGVDALLEFDPFVPDDARLGGPVFGIWEFVRVVVDSDLPKAVMAGFIADVLFEASKAIYAAARAPKADRSIERQIIAAQGIEAMCVQHAQRMNPAHQFDRSQILKHPTETTVSSGIVAVTVGLGEIELTYVIGRDAEPYAIIETSQSAIRLRSTDEWCDWYLPSTA